MDSLYRNLMKPFDLHPVVPCCTKPNMAAKHLAYLAQWARLLWSVYAMLQRIREPLSDALQTRLSSSYMYIWTWTCLQHEVRISIHDWFGGYDVSWFFHDSWWEKNAGNFSFEGTRGGRHDLKLLFWGEEGKKWVVKGYIGHSTTLLY